MPDGNTFGNIVVGLLALASTPNREPVSDLEEGGFITSKEFLLEQPASSFEDAREADFTVLAEAEIATTRLSGAA